MLRRCVAATTLGIAIALLLVSTLTAQTNYKVPRLPDGHPDFQGFWNNTTYTPLERPQVRADDARCRRGRALRLHAVRPRQEPGAGGGQPADVADRRSGRRPSPS